MSLQQLSLYNFRNYRRLEFRLPQGIITIQGDNAQGKTNLLEAIFYLATTRSPRTGSDTELVHWLAWEEEPIPYCRIIGHVQQGKEEERLEVVLTSQNGKNKGRRTLRKQVSINRVNRRALDLVGRMPTVLFYPQDIALVDDGPAIRRRYLDITLCQMERSYCRTLSHYNRLITRRNALLRTLRDERFIGDQLAYWNEKLVEWGTTIMWERYHLLDELDGLAGERHRQLSNGEERLHLIYRPSVVLLERDAPDEVPFPSAMSREMLAAGFRRQIARYQNEEIAAGMTLIGPHRDDFSFRVQGRDLRLYGSRGQQRTATLALKLAEVEAMTLRLGAMPLLLLDDVMAELDAHRRAMVLGSLAEAEQVIITTTDWSVFPANSIKEMTRYRVAAGQILLLT